MKLNAKPSEYLFNATPQTPPSFWENVGNQYRYSYLPSISAAKQAFIGKDDPSFTVTDDMLANEPEELIQDLINSKSQQEFDYNKNLYARMSNIKNSLSINSGFGSMLFAGIFDPVNLIPIPTAIGMGFAKGALRVGAGSAGLTVGTELVRAPNDPTYQPMETVFAVGGSAFFGGLLGGGIGAATAKRAGSNIANATAYDDGMEAKIKKTKVKGKAPNDTMAKETTEPVMQGDANTVLREEGVVPVEEDPRLNKKLDTGYQKTGIGYEFTARGTTLGNALHRTNSQKMEDWLLSVVGDGGLNTKKVKAGGVAFKKGSVNLLRGNWYGASYGYIEDMRNLWLGTKGVIEPRKVATQNVSFTIENIKTKFNKSESFDEFMQKVTKANIKASYFGNDNVIAKEAPHVLEGVRVTRKLNERALKEGQDAGLLNTATNLNKKMDMLADFAGSRLRNINDFKNQLPKTKRPETVNMHIRNEEEALENALHDMQILERFSFSLIRKEKSLYNKLDEVLEDIEIEESTRTSYSSMMENMVKKSGDRTAFYGQLSKKIQKDHADRHKTDLRLFAELRKMYENEGVSDKQLEYMGILEQRILNHKYTPKQQAIIDEYNRLKDDVENGFTTKQKNFYNKMKSELSEPREYDVEATLLSLKNSIKSINKDFTRPSGEDHYTMRKYLVDTIIDLREQFHNEVIVPYIMKNPSGRLATLLDAMKSKQPIIVPADDSLADVGLIVRKPMPKEYFNRVTDVNAQDRAEDIVKLNNKNIYILEDGRHYYYRDKDFGNFNRRFQFFGEDDSTAPLLLKSGFKKKRINNKMYDVFEYEKIDFSNNISKEQLNMLIRQIRFIENKYKGKVDDDTFEKMIAIPRNQTVRQKIKQDNASNKKKVGEDEALEENQIDLNSDLVPKANSFKNKFIGATEVLDIINFYSKKKFFNKDSVDVIPFKVQKEFKSGLSMADGELIKLEVNEQMIKLQADMQATKIINRIIGEGDAQDYDGIAGRGVQKFVMHRNFDIPNYLLTKESNGIADFIDTNGADLMRTYMNKFGPAVEMARMFDGDRFGKMKLYEAFNDVITRHSDDIELNPKDMTDKLFYQRDDIEEMTDAILNRAPRGMEIGSASNRLVKAIQQFAQITMMGTATIAGFADPGKVILSRGFKQAFGRYINSWIRDVNEIDLKDSANKHMLRFIGEGNETLSGAGASRMVEQGTGIGEVNNRVLGKVGDKFFEALDKIAGQFYNVNLLNQWTAINKRMVVPMSVDRIIRSGAMLSKKYTGDQSIKKYLKTDLEILRSHGLSEDDLKSIYALWKSAGGKRGKEIYYSNADLWMEKNPLIFRKFTSAVRADVLSTIITPTEADKPLLSYGLLKLSRFNKNMKDRQHNFFKLPIQFMSWAMAANSKIVLSTLQGRHQGVASGMTAMFALGMLSDYARNPEWWKYKSTTEKVIKAVEYSGLTAYLLDINSFAEIASNNFVVIRPLFGEKNPFTGNLPDQISEVGGPAGSIIADTYKLFADDSLEFKDQANMVKRMIPYNNLFYTKWLFNGLKDSIVNDNNTVKY